MNYFIDPSCSHAILEVYCGPMKSGKSRELLHRVDKLNFVENYNVLFFKPNTDVRDEKVKSRFGDFTYDCHFISAQHPQELLKFIDETTKVVIIDEAQFFSQELIAIVKELLSREINIIVAGLDQDFRAEPFGPMPELLTLAHRVHKLAAVCDYPGCNLPGTRTQRLIDGKPAPYDSPTILVEGTQKETYECRCMKHHEVK